MELQLLLPSLQIAWAPLCMWTLLMDVLGSVWWEKKWRRIPHPLQNATSWILPVSETIGTAWESFLFFLKYKLKVFVGNGGNTQKPFTFLSIILVTLLLQCDNTPSLPTFIEERIHLDLQFQRVRIQRAASKWHTWWLSQMVTGAGGWELQTKSSSLTLQAGSRKSQQADGFWNLTDTLPPLRPHSLTYPIARSRNYLFRWLRPWETLLFKPPQRISRRKQNDKNTIYNSHEEWSI